MLDSERLSISVVVFVGTVPILGRGRGKGYTGKDDVVVTSVDRVYKNCTRFPLLARQPVHNY